MPTTRVFDNERPQLAVHSGAGKFPIHTKMKTASYISSTMPTDPLPQVRLNLSRRACELRFARRRLMLDVREFGIDKRADLARDYPGHLATPPARELIHARVSSFPFAGCACSFFHCAYWRARSSAFGPEKITIRTTAFERTRVRQIPLSELECWRETYLPLPPWWTWAVRRLAARSRGKLEPVAGAAGPKEKTRIAEILSRATGKPLIDDFGRARDLPDLPLEREGTPRI